MFLSSRIWTGQDGHVEGLPVSEKDRQEDRQREEDRRLLYRYLEREVSLHVLDDHHEKGQSYSENGFRIFRGVYESRRDIRTGDLEHQRLDLVVGDPSYVTVLHLTNESAHSSQDSTGRAPEKFRGGYFVGRSISKKNN